MKIVVAGAGAMGSHLAKLLSGEKFDCTIIDEDPNKLGNLGSDYDVMTLEASPTSVEALRNAGVSGADLFIAVTPQQSTNIACSCLAKALGAKKTVARIDTYEYLDTKNKAMFEGMGVSSLIYPEVLAAKDIVNGLKMTWVRKRWDIFGGQLVLLVIKMRETAQILGTPLKDLCGPDDPYHILAIKRGQDTIIPGGYDCVENLDLVYFMTTPEYIPYIRQIVGKEKYEDVHNVMVMGGSKAAVRAALNIPDYINMKIIEKDEARCEQLNELINRKNVMVIHGDGRDMALLREENIANTQAFVALTENAETNILACLAAKRRGVRKTITQVENMDYVGMAESLDLGTVINKKVIAVSHIYQMLLNSDVSNVNFLMSANADVAEFQVAYDAKVTRKPVKDLGLQRGIVLGGLLRDGKGMLISGNTQIKAGDSVMVISHNINLRKIAKLFE